MKRLLAVVVAGALLAAGCVTEEQVGEDAGTRRLSIATGGTGGVYFVLGGGLAELITRNIEGVEATAEVTSASVDNMLLIADGSSDIAFTLADTAADAVHGEAGFDEPVPAVALARLYDNYTQVVTTEDSGIASIEDLAGKRVSVGAPNSGTEVIALRILEAAGIDPDEDISRQQLDVEQSVQAVRDGTMDAFFWSGGLPTGAVTDLATTEDIRILDTTPYLDELRSRYGGFYSEAVIPAGTYEGVDQDVPTIAVPNYLVVHEDFDEDLAFEVTRLLFERRDELAEVHPEAQNVELERATRVEPLEVHPGATRYYEQAG